MKIEYRGIKIEYKRKTIVKVYGVYRTTDGNYLNYKSLAAIEKAIDTRYEKLSNGLENYYRKNGVADTLEEGYKEFETVLVKQIDTFSYRFKDPRNGDEVTLDIPDAAHLKWRIGQINRLIGYGERLSQMFRFVTNG